MPTVPDPVRQEVFEEKGRECVLCGTDHTDRRQSLSVHHINGDQSDNRIENLIPVCQSCHVKIHRHPDGEYAELHEQLPEDRRLVGDDLRELYTERNADRGPDEGYLIVDASDRVDSKLPIEYDYDEYLVFPSEAALAEFIDVWDDRVAGTLYYKPAHPGKRDTTVTHTLSLRRPKGEESRDSA